MEAQRRFFPLVDQLRALAALLVVYSHLVGNFLDSHQRTWPPASLIRSFVITPFHLELNAGWPAVVMFFFISGFVATHAAMSEGGREFALKRLLRVYPPLIALVLVVSVLARLGILTNGVSRVPTALETLAAGTLANFAIGWNAAFFILVAWTLMVEILFYAGVLAVKPLLTRMPWLAPPVLLAVIGILVAIFGTTVPGVIWYLAFVPIPVAGMVIYLLATGRVRAWAGAMLLAASMVLLMLTFQRTNPQLSDPNASYIANVLVVGAIFALAVLLEGRIRPSRILAVLARRTYSLYLVHFTVGLTLVVYLVDVVRLPFSVGLLIALLGTAVATELMHRLVERPAMRLGKWAGLRLRGAPAASEG